MNDTIQLALINLLSNTQLWEIVLTFGTIVIARVGTSAFMANIRAKRQENWLNEVAVLAEEAVAATYNDIVRDAKAAGVFDADAKEDARFDAKQRMLEIAQAKGSTALRNLAADAFDVYIEKAVNSLKADAESAKPLGQLITASDDSTIKEN